MFNRFSAYNQDFADWRRDGYPGVTAETYQYIDFLSDPADALPATRNRSDQ